MLSVSATSVLLMIYFIVKNAKLTKKIDEIAHNCSLTSVYNRRFFLELAKVQFARSLRTGMDSYFIVFDLDNYKEISDKYGQFAADYALTEIAARVKNAIRPYDIIGRYTGEGFIILMTDIAEVDKMNVVSATERILKSICETPIEYEGKKMYASACFGISPATIVQDMGEAIKYAEKAHSAAKKNKQDPIVFHEKAAGA